MNPRHRPSYTASPAMEHGKVPPNAVEFEDPVLGACMLDAEALSDVTAILKPEMFYKLEHQIIFSAIASLVEKGDPVDIITVTQAVKATGQLEKCGGAYYISKLTDRIGGGANAEYHSRIIQQKFLQRELIRVAGDIYHDAFEDTTDALELLDRANQDIASIGSDVVGNGVRSKKEVFDVVVENMERAAAGNSIVGLSIGLPDVEKISGGAQKGHLDIVAARPGMGKSTYALSKAYFIGVILRKPVRIYSVEMTDEELILLLCAIRTQIDSRVLKSGRLTVEQWSAFHEAREVITNSPITIIDGLKQWLHIRRDVLSAHRKEPAALIIFDYIQIMSYPEAKGNREQEISQMSGGMKQLAKDTKTPICALSQLSRAVETRGGTKRPMLSDLRESGSIEQDADSVTFLYRPEYYGIEFSEDTNLPTEGLCEVIIAKNRGGLTGVVPVRVNLATSTFSSFEGQSFKAPSPPQSFSDTPIRSPMPRSEAFDMDSESPF